MRPVNLLPQDLRPRAGTGGRQGSAYVVLGVLGVLVVFMLLYVVTAAQLRSREGDAAVAKREAQQAEARMAALGPYGAFAKMEKTRSASVKDLASSRFDWDRLMRELALVLPRGMWLTEVDAAVSPQEDETASAGANAGAPTAKLVGCAPRQPDVARLMVRFRRMDRVADVTLTESGEEQTDSAGGGAPLPAGGAGGGSGDGCGGLYKFELAVTFEPVKRMPGQSPGAAPTPASAGGGS